MNKDQLKKLPVWAQQYIDKIEGERDAAVNLLNKTLDDSKVSSIYYDALICSGESKSGGPVSKRVYVQSHDVIVNDFGVDLSVRLDHRDKRLILSWSDAEMQSNHVAMVPTGQQQVELVIKDNMRDYR